tara:strand:+ start:647 stop:1144 length:498 start_codon:yes stop_codon:yes gene_type:complete
MRLPRLGGFTTFMKKVLDVPAMGVVALGMLLPTAGNYLYNTVANSTMVPSSITNAMSGQYVQPVVLATASAGVAYLASRFGLVSTSTAVTAATLSTALFVVKALQDNGVAGSGLFPTFQGAHSMMGYRRNSGYLGYLGNVEAAPEMLPAPVETQLFGSSPSFNVF